MIATLLALTLGGASAVPDVPADPLACTTAIDQDADRDGLPDACELDLATRYAPVLMVRRGGCNWDAAAAGPGGGYHFAVQPIGSVVRIAYLPAYFRDCGWSGLKCLVPWIDCSPHAGDSEMIVVELAQREDEWEVTGIFLSAHCFGRSAASCRWYRGSDLEAFSWHGGAPVVWVAEGRHANYPTRGSCDAGHHSVDTCDRHDTQYRFPIVAARNIGSRTVPAADDGCVTGSELGSAQAVADAVECFWTDTPFRGWQDTGRGVTPYHRYLTEIVGY